jgi:hypothetical protein
MDTSTRLTRGLFSLLTKSSLWSFLVLDRVTLSAVAQSPVWQAPFHADSCIGLLTSFQFENTTVISASRVAPGVNFTVPSACQSSAVNGKASICRVELTTSTTNSSSVRMEAWLPDTWYGRFMGLGNGGLGGCELASQQDVLFSLTVKGE